jgi:16S rRNA (uracil1498-N3)-methyltransferase
MAERFYVNFPLAPGEVVLQGPEAHHLANVMRAKPADRVTLFCGDGSEYPAEVQSVDRKSVTLTVAPAVHSNRELSFHLEVATAIPKGDRGDFLVEKLTELGVTKLVPLKTRRSVVHPRIDRLQQTVIQACKQCGRNRLMEIAAVAVWDDYLRDVAASSRRLVAHHGLVSTRPISEIQEVANTVIAIGPEGGFADDEVAGAVAQGWNVVNLGTRVMRIETAAIAAASYFALGNAKTA